MTITSWINLGIFDPPPDLRPSWKLRVKSPCCCCFPNMFFLISCLIVLHSPHEGEKVSNFRIWMVRYRKRKRSRHGVKEFLMTVFFFSTHTLPNSSRQKAIPVQLNKNYPQSPFTFLPPRFLTFSVVVWFKVGIKGWGECIVLLCFSLWLVISHANRKIKR